MTTEKQRRKRRHKALDALSNALYLLDHLDWGPDESADDWDRFEDDKQTLSAAAMDAERALQRIMREDIFCLECSEPIFDYAEFFCPACDWRHTVVSSLWAPPYPLLTAGPALVAA